MRATMSGTASYTPLRDSTAWKYTSPFWAVPLVTGASGLRARERKFSRAFSLTMAFRSASSMASIFWISCEVRNPSKKCRKGTEALIAERCATAARSWASCTEPEASIAKPVWRQAITSWWSPKIERACDARARADTWNTAGSISPAILYIFGIIRRRPCEAVKVVVRAPA